MAQNTSIPVFKLYGESRNWPASDLLHCESIHSRSSLYEWHIRTHQHADLVQLLYLHKGQVEIDIEGVKHQVGMPVFKLYQPYACMVLNFHPERRAIPCHFQHH